MVGLQWVERRHWRVRWQCKVEDGVFESSRANQDFIDDGTRYFGIPHFTSVMDTKGLRL